MMEKPFTGERKRFSVKDVEKIIVELERDTPYPVDIFPEISKIHWKKLSSILPQYGGVSLDRVSGNLMRRGYLIALEDVRRKIKEGDGKNE